MNEPFQVNVRYSYPQSVSSFTPSTENVLSFTIDDDPCLCIGLKKDEVIFEMSAISMLLVS